jgi:acyl carrier protein
MTNHEKLKILIIDTFLLEPSEYRLDLSRGEVETWDSLGVISMAVGVNETFGYHFTPDEANGIQKVSDIVGILKSKGIAFNGEA